MSRQPLGDLLERLAQPRVFAPLLLALAAIVSAWYADSRLPIPDEGAQLTAAAKILRGGVFYREVDAYPFPGATYFLAGWMALLGEHLSVARTLAGLFFCGMVLALYAAALRLLTPPRAALFGLSLLSLKFIAWPVFSAYLYADFALCFASISIALLLRHEFRGPTLPLLVAGVATGIALVTKQNLGIYLAAASGALMLRPAWLTLRPPPVDHRPVLAFGTFALGAALPAAVMAAYFATQGLFQQLVYSGLVRPLTGYLPTSGVSFTRGIAWWRWGDLQAEWAATYLVLDYWQMLLQKQFPFESLYPFYLDLGELFSRTIYTLVPLAFLWALGRGLLGWRHRPVSPHTARLLAFAWLALAVVASAFPRADFAHMIGVFPVVGLLLWALPRAPGRIWLRAEAVVVLVCLLAVSTLALVHRSNLTHRLTLEKADVWVHEGQTWAQPLIEGIQAELRPGDPLFVYGHESHFYFLSGHYFPWPFSQLYPGMAGGDNGRQLTQLLDETRPPLVVQGVQSWPGMPPIETPVLAAYVRAQYELDRRFFQRHPPPSGIRPYPQHLLVRRRVGTVPATESRADP